jgi:hypothetical protein
MGPVSGDRYSDNRRDRQDNNESRGFVANFCSRPGQQSSVVHKERVNHHSHVRSFLDLPSSRAQLLFWLVSARDLRAVSD